MTDAAVTTPVTTPTTTGAADFCRDTAVRPLGDGRYAATIPDDWRIIYAFGGVSMAVAVRAVLAEIDRPDLDLLSAHALFCSPMPELQKDGFPYQQLHENDSRIVTGAGNTRYDEARSLRELIGAPWCLPLQGTQPREYVTRALAAKGLPAPADTIETSDLFTTLAILDSGPYLAILPARVADDLAQSGLIRSLQVAMDGSFPSVGIVWNENASQPAVRQFRTFIERDLA